MKLSAHVYGEWLAVPCQGTETVRWLADEALRRYFKANPPPSPIATANGDSESSSGSTPEVQEVRLMRGGARLDWDDNLSSVIDDNDFVTIGEDKIKYKLFLNYVCSVKVLVNRYELIWLEFRRTAWKQDRCASFHIT